MKKQTMCAPRASRRRRGISRIDLEIAIDEYLHNGGKIRKVVNRDVIPASSKAFPENYHGTSIDGDSEFEEISSLNL